MEVISDSLDQHIRADEAEGVGRTAVTRGSTRWPQVDPKGMDVIATLV